VADFLRLTLLVLQIADLSHDERGFRRGVIATPRSPVGLDRRGALSRFRPHPDTSAPRRGRTPA
jgi:hypothetical protein